MVPFFGGSIKQNTRMDQHQTTLDLFTGSEFMKPPKKEVETMFVPEKDVGNVNGLKESYNNDRERYIQSNYQNGIKTGTWITYYESGKEWTKGNYINNKRSGEWIFYNRDGTVFEKKKY